MHRKTGAYRTVLTAVPTLDTNVFAAGELVGSAEIELAPAANVDGIVPSSGVIQSVIIIDEDAQAVNLEVYFFDAEPANTTFTENSAFSPADTDLDALIGVAAVSTWFALNDNSVGQVLDLAMPFVLAVGLRTIYAVLVTRGTPTYTATGLTLRVAIQMD